MKCLSIVVPVYNEEANIKPLYTAVASVLGSISECYKWEFVFTDNGSTDATFAEIEALAAQDPRVRAYRFTKNFGFQRSILAGYCLARGDAAIQIDADLQDPPEVILDFVRLWEADYKIVFGIRRSRPESLFLHVSRRLFYRIISWISADSLPHDAGDFRLVDRCVLELLQNYRDENPYLRGYIANLGYRQIGVAYDRAPRKSGTSSFRFWNLVELAVDGIVSHSILPLRLASLVGITVSIIAVLTILAYLVLYQESWPAGFATLAVLMLVSLAMNAIFLGIIGEYLARIFKQVKPRPIVIVERFIDSAPAEAEKKQISGIVFPAD